MQTPSPVVAQPLCHFPREQRTLAAWLFLLCACIPWLNPVAGGAMTPAIPLITGWVCIAVLLLLFPALHAGAMAGYLAAFLVTGAVLGILLDVSWQLLMLGCLMMGAAALVGSRLAQQDVLEPQQQGGDAVALIAWSWLMAGLLSALIGLLQYFQLTAWLGGLVNHAPAGQVYGNLRQRNQYASLMNIALWALWYLWYSGRLQRLWGHAGQLRPRTAGLVALLLMLPLAVSMGLTLSRTGMVQMLLTIVLMLWWTWRLPEQGRIGRRRNVLLWLLALALTYLVSSYVLPHWLGGVDIMVRVQGADSRMCISRTVLWGNVLDLIAQRPWSGWGWGQLDIAHYYANYGDTRFCDMLDNAHNLPLHLAIELGLPVAVLFCLLLAGWVLWSRPWAERSARRQLMWGVLAVIGIHSLLEYPLWYAPFQLACGLALGVLLASQRPLRARAEGAGLQGRSWLLAQQLVAVVMLSGLAYASFDFVRVTQLYTAPEARAWLFRDNTLAQAQRTPLYQNAVNFAMLSTVPLTPANAGAELARAQALMHYSPEARVVQRIIEAQLLLGQTAAAEQTRQHFRQVYPQQHDAWLARRASAAAGQ